MAYSRPPYESRPSPYDPERSRSSWDPIQRPHYPSIPSPSHHNMASPSPTLFDPESESSEVSDTPGDDYQTRVHSSYPTPLPPPPTKHVFESLESIEARLRDLQRIEDDNIRKQERLKAKRFRKDDKIRRKREAQDLKIKAIMDARARHDERISRRRRMEDDAYERFDQELEEEENNLRRRQKRLKRGLPVEEIGLGSRISSASMSPPGPVYSSIPPPAKRHQTGPPGQNDSPITSTPRPISHGPSSAPNSAGPNPPPYAFLQSTHPPASSPYGRSPTISSRSPSTSSGAFPSIPRSHQPSTEPPPPPPPPFGVNGHSSSPLISRPLVAPSPSILNTQPPPRQPITSYDTRPPPVASGFATINTPPTSGFAPINPRNAATPPATASVPIVKKAEHEHVNGQPRPYTTDGTPTGGSTATSSKRTPSTTHPYQMSEAFANRHHHCERVDLLNRGIWTSYGAGGTKEIPTGPAQEMYLRCNHDGCRRIDWRTVHGLQCHIVKNHEQPKGTIGSLEKALDRYGVPVVEVEAYEREHGDGTGGTMADPKNLKLKTKSRESTEKVDGQRRSYPVPLNSNGYKSNATMSLGTSAQPYQGSPASVRSLTREETEDSESDSRTPPVHLAAKPLPPRSSGFAAVNGSYSIVPGPRPAEPKDIDMKDSPSSSHSSTPGSAPPRDINFWKPYPTNAEPPKPQHVGNIPPPNPGPTQFHGAPTSAPAFPPIDYVRPNQTPPNPMPPMQVLNASTSPFPLIAKQEDSPTQEQMKINQIAPASATPVAVQEKPSVVTPESVRPPLKAAPPPLATPPALTQLATPVKEKEKESSVVQENQKEPEPPKADMVTPNRSEPKSPEQAMRRQSVSVRSSTRRSSVAANRAVQDRQKEREEVVTKVEPEVEAEKEKQQQEKDEVQVRPDLEQDGQLERDDDQDDKDDSDDPDTITAAVPSSFSKDKDRENRENKTTPRRQANGRFLRKGR